MQTADASRSGLSYRLKSAQDLIRNRYSDSTINLSSVAREVGLSPGHLSRLFSREAGVGFRLFVRNIRVEQAVILLKDPKLRVKEIALMVGYMLTTAFDRDFRACHGMSPTEFRCKLLVYSRGELG